LCLITFGNISWQLSSLFFHPCASQCPETGHDSFLPHPYLILIIFPFLRFRFVSETSKSLTEQTDNWTSSTIFHSFYENCHYELNVWIYSSKSNYRLCNYLILQLHDWELNMMQTIFSHILFHCRWFEETRPHIIHEPDSQAIVTNAVCCSRHKSPQALKYFWSFELHRRISVQPQNTSLVYWVTWSYSVTQATQSYDNRSRCRSGNINQNYLLWGCLHTDSEILVRNNFLLLVMVDVITAFIAPKTGITS
jgi:hypothetical protein